ncbi:hypothetical protein [Cloacibacterium sp.]|uniref:hypothetical protein n=1 Tax=Cloacibacterium sp. TaxID=1913682 RepID=UPI0039E3A5D4
MRNLIKTLTIISFLIFNISCAQTIMRKVADAKKLEINKKEFIGKPLSYLLKTINPRIVSVIPTPNKNFAQINTISFLFVSFNDYRRNFNNNNQNTKITIRFNQNWDLIGEKCKSDILKCTEWTKEDEKNLGDLVVYDIYVTGKD